ncbi:MAG: hypothetical protein AAF500_11645 [Myxococcota bacterium]
MAPESNDRTVMIAILLSSTLLTMLGIVGILNGTNHLQTNAIPADPFDLYDGQPAPETEAEAQERLLNLQLQEAEATNPYRRPMAAANVVVSSLVLVGSFMLSWRRKLSQWWIRQAVIAKLIWIVGYTTTLVFHLRQAFPLIPTPNAEGVALTQLTWSIVLASLITAALHATAAWRVSRADITDFIEASRRS